MSDTLASCRITRVNKTTRHLNPTTPFQSLNRTCPSFRPFPSSLNHPLSAAADDWRTMQRRNGGILLRSTLPFARWISARNSCSKLFVGGLSYDTNETVLKDAFRQHGEIIEVKVICDHVSGKSKGYGFVQFTSETAASKALQELNDQLLDGRNIRVHYAHKG